MLLESLALSYRQALAELSALTGNKFRRLCMVGGGTRNALLCRFIADATGLEVMAGPAEATVMGNLAVQALACGRLDSADQVRKLVRDSAETTSYQPENSEIWARQYDRYLDLAERTKEF
jgi:sugar (pentulose or hexulose) kinase